MHHIQYKPRSVRELLTEMKDTSDLMIDLAYASLLYESTELAGLVHKLETKMDELMYTIRIMAAAAARNVREAQKITGILQVARATEAISNSTGEMADLIRRRMKIHPVIKDALRVADEKIIKIKVSGASMVAGKKLAELKLPSSMGVFVLAIKRKNEWTTPPTKDSRILPRDEIVVKGPWHGIRIFGEMAGVHVEPFTPGKELQSLRKELSKIRDLSDVTVDLAYSSLMLGSTDVAEDVREIEEDLDKFTYRAWLDTLTIASRLESDIPRLNSVLQVVKSMERISNAADAIVDIVLRKIELHPVFARALAETAERICRVRVPKNSEMVGMTLDDLNLWETTGVYVLIIRRGRQHIITPGHDVKLRAGDILTLRGSPDGIEKLQKGGFTACELYGAKT